MSNRSTRPLSSETVRPKTPPPSQSSPPSQTPQASQTSRAWRTTVRQGLALWGITVFAWMVLPAAHPAQLLVAISGLYGTVLLPTALYFDAQQRQDSSVLGRLANALDVSRIVTGLCVLRANLSLIGQRRRTAQNCSCKR